MTKPPRAPGPVRQRVPPLGGQHHAGGRLVRGRHHHGPGAAGGQRGDHQALVVDGDVHHPQADRGRRAHRLVGRGAAVAGILERHRADAGLAGQRAQHQVEPLREAGADDHPARVGGGRAHPPQVPGQHLAQHRAAARVAVAEVGRGDGAAGLADRPHPVGPREARQVGDARARSPRSARRKAGVPAGWAATARSGWPPATTAPMSATRVAEPVRLVRYPSASSWPKHSCTMPRDTPSSRASSREDGSRSPPRSRPLLIASRRPASSCARNGRPDDRSSRTSSSGLKPDHSIAMESDLTSEPVAPYRRWYEHLDASTAACRHPVASAGPASSAGRWR